MALFVSPTAILEVKADRTMRSIADNGVVDYSRLCGHAV